MIALAAIASLVSLSDLRHRRIPNSLSGSLALLALAFQAVRATSPGALRPLPLSHALSLRLAPPVTCVVVALFCLVTLLVAELARRRATDGPGMGMGDVKYLSAWALALGPHVVPAACAGCLCGALVALARGKPDFALGPWVSLAGVAACVALLVA